ncbi:sigma-70 family RNA polymerase sigma factor [Clostridium frigidicarnis]|uniref:RNA polymerase sigma factor, sigma-70 family n=1 Tax=Clostridium frigidicarnis TaxID=84698 RepID=A0A1I1ANY0_9CLOT|nr:sigma-70 family RNA polymerase sigma factor [Clostridium frigidicarnis]SFB38080.1 RNA polymerase sigma factor, sigma-70 family [Clostridium frigidicarnis]
MSSLYNIISSFNSGNSDEFLKIVETFDPLLKSLHKKSENDDTYSDLNLFLIQLMNKIPLHKEIFKENKYLISYISKSLKNHYIYLNKRNSKIYNTEFSSDLIDLDSDYTDSNNTIFKDLLNHLTDLEKKIIIYKYIHSYSDIEIGKLRNVSRQSVHKTHKRALKKLKEVI